MKRIVFIIYFISVIAYFGYWFMRTIQIKDPDTLFKNRKINYCNEQYSVGLIDKIMGCGG